MQQEPLDATTALIYRKMLFQNNDTNYVIPESLLAIHRRMWQLMDGIGGRSRIDVPSAAVVVLVWQQTTEEGQDFLIQQGSPLESVPERTMVPGEAVDWLAVPEDSDVMVDFNNAYITAKFLGATDENRLKVKIPGTTGKYRVVDRDSVRLISVS